MVAFEVKAAARVPGDEFKGLRKLRDLVGDAFIGGVVLYTGSRAYMMENKLCVMPIDRLWTGSSGDLHGRSRLVS